MKNITKYIGLAFASALAFSACDKNLEPTFDDKDAFVAFEKTAYSVSESYSEKGDVYKIPVTLASVAGLEATIKFEVGAPETKAAAEGKNFELVTTTGTLSFDAEHRTQYVEFKTLMDGEYTGDLSFTITLNATEGVAVGTEKVCTVTLNDVDHPLSFMLGDYTMTGIKYGQSAATSWTMTILKDAKDDSKVWFDNLFGNSGWISDDTRFYGVVSSTTDPNSYVLNIPFGQETEYKYQGTTPVKLYGLTKDLDGYDSGSVNVAVSVDGSKVTLDFGTEYGFWFYIQDAGSIGTWLPGLSAVKN